MIILFILHSILLLGIIAYVLRFIERQKAINKEQIQFNAEQLKANAEQIRCNNNQININETQQRANELLFTLNKKPPDYG